MKHLILLLLLIVSGSIFGQDILKISGKGKLIADFTSTGDAENVKGQFLGKYQALVSTISGTQTVKCMVRVENTVNVIGVWEMNDLNDIRVKVYEVEMQSGITDILLVGVSDGKAIAMNLFRLNGEDLDDLGYNYLEQKTANQPIEITIGSDRVQIIYDNGTEKPAYGLINGVFTEIL